LGQAQDEAMVCFLPSTVVIESLTCEVIQGSVSGYHFSNGSQINIDAEDDTLTLLGPDGTVCMSSTNDDAGQLSALVYGPDTFTFSPTSAATGPASTLDLSCSEAAAGGEEIATTTAMRCTLPQDDRFGAAWSRCDAVDIIASVTTRPDVGTDQPLDASGSGTDDGEASCMPNCTDAQCGPDGCGGSCGECNSGLICDVGRCVTDSLGSGHDGSIGGAEIEDATGGSGGSDTTTAGDSSSGGLDMTFEQDPYLNCLAAMEGMCQGLNVCAGDRAQDVFGILEGELVEQTFGTGCAVLTLSEDLNALCLNYVNDNPGSPIVLYLRYTPTDVVRECSKTSVSSFCAPPLLTTAWAELKDLFKGNGIGAQTEAWLIEQVETLVGTCINANE
jgi:hypothetical protein